MSLNDSEPTPPAALLIAGPTGAGKSALALTLAEQLNATIINADSMQVYRELEILTARPDPAALAAAPHRLYGHRGAAQPYSVADWLDDAGAALSEASGQGRPAIFVGGTGLYFQSLIKGLADIPDIPDEIRNDVRARAEADPQANYERLKARDPIMAARLAPGDRQRVARALEVIEATNRSLDDYQRSAHPAIPLRLLARIVLLPDRALLYRSIETRFDRMMQTGALEEVAQLHRQGLDSGLPAMKALGVPPLISYLEDEISLQTAIEQAKRDSRRYAKRQSTWFRNQCDDWQIADSQTTAIARFSALLP